MKNNKKYTPLYLRTNDESLSIEDRDRSFYKRIYSNEKQKISEIAMFHIFLTKKYVSSSIARSFTDCTKIDLRGKVDPRNFSRFKSLKNILTFLSIFIDKKSSFSKDFQGELPIAKKLGLGEIGRCLPKHLMSEKEEENFHARYEKFINYIHSLHLDLPLLLQVMAKIGSYFLHLLEELNMHSYEHMYNYFNRYKITRAESVMLDFLRGKKGKGLELKIMKTYQIKTRVKAEKGAHQSIVYHYVVDRRYLNKKIIFKKNMKPKYHAWAPGFYNALYAQTELVNKDDLFSLFYMERGLFALKLICLELISVQRIDDHIKSLNVQNLVA